MSFRSVALFALALASVSPRHASADPTVDRLIEQGHWTRARAALEPLARAHPDDPAVRVARARIEQAFGDLDAAETDAERAVKLAPNDAAAHAALAEVCGQKAQRANPLSQLGLARRFKKEADAALALDPGRVEIQLDLIAFHMQAPGIAGGDRARAKELVDHALAQGLPWAWRARERLANETRDSVALAAIYHDAAAKHPDDYRARVALASWLAAPWRGPAADAETEARAALALDPDRTAAWTVLAIILANGGRWDELDRTLADAEAKVPDDLSPWYQAGRVCLVQHGDAARAERMFRHYLGRDPEAGAVPAAAAHWRLGLALEKQGRAADAAAELTVATRLDPHFEPARKDLKRLKS